MKDIQFPIRHSSSFSSAAPTVTCAFIRSLSFGSQTKLIWITHIFPWESTSPRIQNDVYEDEYTPSVLYHLLRFSSFLNYFSRHWKKKVSQHLCMGLLWRYIIPPFTFVARGEMKHTIYFLSLTSSWNLFCRNPIYI